MTRPTSFAGGAAPSPSEHELSLDESAWSLGEDAFAWIERSIRERLPCGPRCLLEYGSGPSSIRWARAFTRASVMAVESDPAYLQQTATLANRFGVANLVIHYCPLRWRLTVAGLALTYSYMRPPTPVDVAIVDGPPGWTVRGRQAALFDAARSLKVGGLLFLYGMQRASERRAVAHFLSSYSHCFAAETSDVGHGVARLVRVRRGSARVRLLPLLESAVLAPRTWRAVRRRQVAVPKPSAALSRSRPATGENVLPRRDDGRGCILSGCILRGARPAQLSRPKSNDMIAVLAPTFMPRSQTFFYRHIQAFGARCHVYYSRRAHEAEFPMGAARGSYLGWRGSRVEGRIVRSLARLGAPRPECLTPTELLRLASALRRDQPTVAYTMFLWHAIDFLQAVRIAGTSTRLCVHVGGSDLTGLSARGPRRRKRALTVLRQAALVTVGSQFLASLASSLLQSSRAVVVHYLGVSLPSHMPTGRPSTGCVRFLAVCRLVPVKGPLHLIHAFAEAKRAARSPLRLLVVGDGPMRADCERLVVELGLSADVELLGSRPHSDTLAAIDACDVLVQFNVALPTGVQEALGGSLLEAQARGKPVIVTRSGGTAEAVTGSSAVLIEGESIAAFARAMVDLASSPRLRERMGLAGRAFVAQTHNADLQDRRFVELVLSACMGNGPRMLSSGCPA